MVLNIAYNYLSNWLYPISNSVPALENTDVSDDSFVYVEDSQLYSSDVNDDNFEFINHADAEEIDFPTQQSIVPIGQIAGFNKHKLIDMINFSKISYGNNDNRLALNGYITKAELINSGYKIIPFYNGTELAGYIFAKGKEINIAYHGTQNINDVLTDVNAVLTPLTILNISGRAHRGFYQAFKGSAKSLYKNIYKHLKEEGLNIKEIDLGLTGHSMGGAIAKIAALWFKQYLEVENIHVATFGDPRVFDLTASRMYNELLGDSTIRATQHRQDPVPTLPLGISGYAHVGAQLRVPAIYGTVHKIDGYKEAIKNINDEDFRQNNDISYFYYPVKVAQILNDLVIGNVQNVIYACTDKFYNTEFTSWAETIKNNISRNVDKSL